MMKTKYIIYTLLFSVALWSCDLMGGVDNVKPYYKLEDQNAIRDAKSAEQVLRGVYGLWRAWDLCVFRTNMSITAGSMAFSGSGGILGEAGFVENNVQADNEIIGNVYTQLYAVINAANFMTEYLKNHEVKDLDEVRKKEIMGEGYFHRALAHFMLLRHFGQFYDLQSAYGIVLSEEPYRTPLARERSSVVDCYQLIESDLDSAILYAPEMPMSNYAPTHAMISQTTAKALKAKVMLSKGDFTHAAELSGEVIASAGDNGYALTGYMDIFGDMFDSEEVLFAPYVEGYDEACDFTLNRITYSQYTKTLADVLNPGAGVEDSGEGYDPRFVETLMHPDVITASFQNGKYPHSTMDDGKANTYYFLRLGEIYYIHAEAEARLGGAHLSAARASLQEVLDAHVPGVYDVSTISDDELLEAIRQHKWIDLACENYEEWFDLVRYYKNGDLDISTVRPNIKSDRQLILPMPQSALAGNNLLVQNP